MSRRQEGLECLARSGRAALPLGGYHAERWGVLLVAARARPVVTEVGAAIGGLAVGVVPGLGRNLRAEAGFDLAAGFAAPAPSPAARSPPSPAARTRPARQTAPRRALHDRRPHASPRIGPQRLRLQHRLDTPDELDSNVDGEPPDLVVH